MLEPRVSTPSDNIPLKTPDGVAELGQRLRKLGQRYRTVLLLVDGRRSEAQVRQMAVLAGAPDALFEELVSMGLIARGVVPVPVVAPATVAPDGRTGRLDVDIDLAAEPARPSGFEVDSVSAPLTPSLSLLADPNSRFDSLHGDLPTPSGLSLQAELEVLLGEVRGLLLRALLAEAPVSGSLTMLRVRRARTRDDLEGLLDEIESRITKPGREFWAAQTLEQVRDLLRSHAVQSMPMPFA
jgi:hypothetical protein